MDEGRRWAIETFGANGVYVREQVSLEVRAEHIASADAQEASAHRSLGVYGEFWRGILERFEAFGKLPKETIASLLKPENKDRLTAILTYHVVPGRVYADQVVKTPSATTVQGGKVMFKVDGGKATINGANIVTTDIETSNGVIHVIDTVIMPK